MTTSTYRDAIRCACIDCDRPLFRMKTMPDGKTLPLCNAHTIRYIQKGVIGGPVGVPVTCKLPGCNNPRINQNRCAEHRGVRLAPPNPATCEVPGCDRSTCDSGRYRGTSPAYCKAHYERARKNDGNVYAEIPLGKTGHQLKALSNAAAARQADEVGGGEGFAGLHPGPPAVAQRQINTPSGAL